MARKKVENVQYYGTGRRKASVARVYVTNGTGKITVNGRDVNEYMPYATLVMDLKQPLEITNTTDKFDVNATVTGGGFTGQAGAIRLGIARALLEISQDFSRIHPSITIRIIKHSVFYKILLSNISFFP